MISHTNDPIVYFLHASHLGVLWVCILLLPLLLPWDEGLGQVSAEAPHHKVSLVVHIDFKDLLFRGSLVKSVSPWKPLLKKRTHKVCIGIFKTPYSWTIQEPHRPMHKQEHLPMSLNQNLSSPPQ